MGIDFKMLVADRKTFIAKRSDIKDSSWSRRTPFASLDYIDDGVAPYLFRNDNEGVYTDTSFGGHRVINPPYGFTTFADPPIAGRMHTNQPDNAQTQPLNVGMGRYYRKAIDKHLEARTLTMTFGVPDFKSMLSFYMNAVDYEAIVTARTGTSAYYNVGKGIGLALLGRGAFGVFGRVFMKLAWWMIAFQVVGTVLSKVKAVALGFNDPRYYSLRETPHIHLKAANNILANFAAERGLITPIISGISEDLKLKPVQKEKYGRPVVFNDEDTKELQALIPYLFLPGGFISLPAYISRSQSVYLGHLKIERAILKDKLSAMSDFDEEYSEVSKKILSMNDALDNVVPDEKPPVDFDKYFEGMIDNPSLKDLVGQVDPTKKEKPATIDTVDDSKPLPKLRDANGEAMGPEETKVREEIDSQTNYAKGLEASIKEGLSSISFVIDYQGATTATFSNSFKDVPVKDTINSVSGGVRDLRFSMNGGNVAGDTIAEITSKITSVVMGAADMVTGGLSSAFAGALLGAYFDFPQMWDDSTTTFDTHTFSMDLGGPYGNTISLLRDIDIPLSLILAGGLPQGLGRSAYGSPFLCSAHVRGSCNIDLGMISEITYESKTGDMGVNTYGMPIAGKLTFKVIDLSPLTTTGMITASDGALSLAADETSALNRYIKVLTGASYNQIHFKTRGLIRRASAAMFGATMMTSGAGLASLTSDTLPFRVFRALSSDESIATMYE